MFDNKMMLGMVISAALSSGFRKTFGAARESVDRLGSTARRATDDVGRLQRKQQDLAASRQKVVRGLAVAATAAYSIGRMFEKSMDQEEQIIRLRTVINAEDADAAVGRSVAHARETARKSLASESELLQIQYELNSAGLDEKAAQAGSNVVAQVAKVTSGEAGQVAKVMATVRNNMGGEMARIGDVLTQTQFKFAISDFGQLGEGMAEAAAGAVAAKLPLEQTAAAVGALNTAGLTGSRAGTALNALLRQLGKAGDDLGFAMVRGADGSLDLGATLQALEERLPDPADIDARNEAIQRLFGDEGKAGLVPLIADLDKYRAGLQSVSQAEGVVDQSIQRFLDSSGGQWQMLTQNLTAIGAVLGGTMLPPLNDILTPMANLAGEIGKAIERFPLIGHALGAALKLRGARLAFVPAGAGEVTLRPEGVAEWRLLDEDRDGYASARARWWDWTAARAETVEAGAGDPVLVLPDLGASAAEAGATARAALSTAARQAAEFAYRTTAGRPALRAGVPLRLDSFRPGLAGKWIVTAAEHLLDTAIRTHSRAVPAA